MEGPDLSPRTPHCVCAATLQASRGLAGNREQHRFAGRVVSGPYTGASLLAAALPALLYLIAQVSRLAGLSVHVAGRGRASSPVMCHYPLLGLLEAWSNVSSPRQGIIFFLVYTCMHACASGQYSPKKKLREKRN